MAENTINSGKRYEQEGMEINKSNLTELSLFTGAGGGVYASILLNHRVIGYVENDDYRQQIISQRIKEGIFDEAPIFGNIIAFNNEGYAESYKGVVDIISAGFPCQPFSVSGKMLAEKDNRNLWPETIRTIRIIQPEFAFLENVASLLVSGYMGRIYGDLAESGYNARWIVLGSQVAHNICEGKRLWILASKTYCPVLESMDIYQDCTIDPKESFRWQYSRAIRKTFSQNDYSRIKRNTDAVARGKYRLEAIGNGQVPVLAAFAFQYLISAFKKK